MQKDKGNNAEDDTKESRKGPPGGRARERLKQFEEERGINTQDDGEELLEEKKKDKNGKHNKRKDTSTDK